MTPANHPPPANTRPPTSNRHFFDVPLDIPKPINLDALDEDQRAVVDAAVERKNLFITGGGGCGKSYLLSTLVDALRQKLRHRYMVAITASTGMAASKIGGKTIHSWAGLTGSETTVAQALQRIRNNPQSLNRWIETEALISDEVSTIAAPFFDMLEQIARILRGNELPFGGIQIILSGDFLQLPPITTSKSVYTFQAKSWPRVIQNTFVLSRIHRQSEPGNSFRISKYPSHQIDFIHALNRCRIGDLDDASITLFNSLSRPLDPNFLPHLEPVRLYSRRKDVNDYNERRLGGIIHEPLMVYTSHDWTSSARNNKHLDKIPVQTKITLAIGAQVMLLKNLDDGLTNGIIGVIKGFYSSHEVEDEGTANQLCKKIGYVRNVRVENDIPIHRAERSTPIPSEHRFPLITFNTLDGPEHVLLMREEFKFDMDGRVVAKRVQLPLSLAWAVSIHKTQGHTFDKVVVDLDGIFAQGQAYVALSRARTKAGLQIRNFSRDKIRVNPIPLQWYKAISAGPTVSA